MKKLLLGLGAATSAIAPIVAVVACSDDDKITPVVINYRTLTTAAKATAKTAIDTALATILPAGTTIKSAADIKTSLNDSKTGNVEFTVTTIAVAPKGAGETAGLKKGDHIVVMTLTKGLLTFYSVDGHAERVTTESIEELRKPANGHYSLPEATSIHTTVTNAKAFALEIAKIDVLLLKSIKDVSVVNPVVKTTKTDTTTFTASGTAAEVTVDAVKGKLTLAGYTFAKKTGTNVVSGGKGIYTFIATETTQVSGTAITFVITVAVTAS